MSAPMKKSSSMQAFSCMVKVVTRKGVATQVWNTKSPMAIGHPMRWEMSAVDGGIRFRAPWTKAEHFVTEKEIASGKAFIALPCSTEDKSTVRIELSPIVKLVPAFQSPTASTGDRLKLFHTIGEWAVESVVIEGKYVAKSGGKKIFKLKGNAEGVYAPNAMIEIKAMVTGVILRIGKTEKKLSAGETHRVRFLDVSGVVIGHGGSEWRLASFVQDQDPAYLAAPISDEAGTFRKSFMAAAAACLLFGFVLFMMPKPSPVATLEPLRVKIQKKKHGVATAAPKGDPRARDFSIGKSGSAKNAGKKGALAQSKKVSPAGRPTVAASASKPKMKVAKAQSKAKAAPKARAKVAHQAAPKPSKPSMVAVKGGLKRVAKVAPRPAPAPMPHSALFKAFSSNSFQKTAKGLAAGGAATGSASAADAHRLGSASGTGRGDLGGTGGVETRSAAISGFGGGGNANGDGGPGSSGAGYGRGSNSKVSGRGRSLVSMDTGAADVDEGLTLDQVGRVIHAHWNEIRYCNDSAALRATGPNGIEGRMTTKFAINASGDVVTVGVGSSTIGDRRLHDCIVGHLKGWKFPKPRGGVTVAVAYPFMFKTITR